jgi:DNA modification methylase
VYGKKAVGPLFDPPNPASVIEETGKNIYGEALDSEQFKQRKFMSYSHDPPNPVSVIEEKGKNIYGEALDSEQFKQKKFGHVYDPPNPPSVIEEDEPMSMYESKKVFIGKRNHQTEKPQDILEFFLKYWSDEGDVILDPTMGSGSTGVACKKMKRNFIGIELTDKYYEVAQKRINPED